MVENLGVGKLYKNTDERSSYEVPIVTVMLYMCPASHSHENHTCVVAVYPIWTCDAINCCGFVDAW